MQTISLIHSKIENDDIFITIDDLQSQARKLLDSLLKLGNYKHPLKVRKGSRKEVTPLSDQNDLSKTLKAGKKTYFFDVKETKEGKPYLVITETWFKPDAEGKEPERNNILVFPEQAREFGFCTVEMLGKIIQE